MPQDLRIWEVGAGSHLVELAHAKLDLEDRLEEWLARDISILASDLLVIGRQTPTDFGGYLDLLCIDGEGDLVVLELKRDKTPREITAQALDYASWVQTLSNDRITKIADTYLGEAGPLHEAYVRKFSAELPETLNQSQKIVVVASTVDPSTERIIEYLSDTYGVNINAVTFTYFRSGDGEREFLGRVFLLDPHQVDYKSETKSASKRRRNLSFEELEQIADQNSVGPLYRELVEQLKLLFSQSPDTTRSSIRFVSDFGDTKRAVAFSLVPVESSENEGLRFIVYMPRFMARFGLDEAAVLRLLPERREPYSYTPDAPSDLTGYAGYFRSHGEVERFVSGLKTEGKAR